MTNTVFTGHGWLEILLVVGKLNSSALITVLISGFVQHMRQNTRSTEEYPNFSPKQRKKLN